MPPCVSPKARFHLAASTAPSLLPYSAVDCQYSAVKSRIRELVRRYLAITVIDQNFEWPNGVGIYVNSMPVHNRLDTGMTPVPLTPHSYFHVLTE